MSIAYFSLTQRCTHNCITCPCSSAGKWSGNVLNFEKFKSDIQKALPNGLSGVVLSGGEPTLHPDFFKMLDFLATLKLKVCLLTNAIRFSDLKFSVGLLDHYDSHMMRVITAIHSFDPIIHDSVTRMDGSLEKTLKGLDNLHKTGCKISIKHMAIKPTILGLQNFVRDFYDRFTDDVSLILCNIDYKGSAYANRDMLLFDLRETGRCIDAALTFVEGMESQGSKRNVKVYDTPCCTIERRHWNFLHSQAKLLLALYDDPANSPDKIDRSVRNSSGPFFDACKKCSERSRCPGTWHSRCDVETEMPLSPFVDKGDIA